MSATTGGAIKFRDVGNAVLMGNFFMSRPQTILVITGFVLAVVSNGSILFPYCKSGHLYCQRHMIPSLTNASWHR
jgi:hypothetical protein